MMNYCRTCLKTCSDLYCSKECKISLKGLCIGCDGFVEGGILALCNACTNSVIQKQVKSSLNDWRNTVNNGNRRINTDAFIDRILSFLKRHSLHDYYEYQIKDGFLDGIVVELKGRSSRKLVLTFFDTVNNVNFEYTSARLYTTGEFDISANVNKLLEAFADA